MNKSTILVPIVAFLAMLPIDAKGQSTYPLEFRLGVHAESANLSTTGDNSVDKSEGVSLRGIEVSLFPAGGGAGIGGRLIEGPSVGSEISLKEALLFVGTQGLHLEAGYGQRSSPETDSTNNFTRAGLRAVVRVGGSGISLSFSGSKYLPAQFSKQKTATGQDQADVGGWEGETGVSYTAPRVPVFAQLGYRNEYFSYGTHEQNIHSIIFGIGLWLGGR